MREWRAILSGVLIGAGFVEFSTALGHYHSNAYFGLFSVAIGALNLRIFYRGKGL